MRAIIASTPGGPEVLTPIDRAMPEPGPSEVLIRVQAAGVNRADTLQRQGFYDPPPGSTDILGLECAGIITGHGSDLDPDMLPVGTPVIALLTGGGYAEHVCVPVGQVARVPSGLTPVEAASIMEVAATVWSNVVMTAGLKRGELLLVHGGSSGIGTMAIQIAKAIGADVAVTAGTDEKLAACRDLGADIAINYREDDFVDTLKSAGRKPDVILDNMGAKYLDRNVRALATGGRLVTIGLQGGTKAELNIGLLLSKRASVTATSLRARPVEEKTVIVRDVVEHVWPLIDTGQVRPIVHQVFELSDASAAHQLMEESSHIGKIVLQVSE